MNTLDQKFTEETTAANIADSDQQLGYTNTSAGGERRWSFGTIWSWIVLKLTANAAAVRTALGLGNAATLDTGTTTGTVCAGDDSRLSDARTPTSHTHDQSDITDLETDLADKALIARAGYRYELSSYSVTSQTGSSVYIGGLTDGLVPAGVRVVGFEIEITSGSIDAAYLQFEADSGGALTTITETRTLDLAYDDLAIIKDTDKLSGSGALILKGTFNTLTATIRVLGEKMQ